MNIHTAAQKTGLSARQIRTYEQMGLIAQIARTKSGYRDYNAAHLERLMFIKRARDVGFSLKEIKTLLVLKDDPYRNNRTVKSLTAEHIHSLNQKITQLTDMKNTLQTWHDSCKADGTADCNILEHLTQPHPKHDMD